MENKTRKVGKQRVEVPEVEVPKAIETEQGIACIAANYPNEFVAQMNEVRFNTNDIFDPLARAIIETVINQTAKNLSCEIRVLFEKTRERLPETQFHQISDLTTSGGVLSALKEMLEIVRNTAKRRALLVLSYQLQHDIRESANETSKLLSSTVMEVEALARELSPPKSMDTKTLIYDALKRYEHGDAGVRISTGYKKLDNLTPIRLGDFLVIGGETKSGKTMLALNIIANILAGGATKSGVLICSLEMPSSQIIDRLVAKIGSVPLRELAEGVRSQHCMNGVQRAMNSIIGSNLVVRDDLHDIASIVATARSMAKSESGLAVMFVDYIQLVRCDLGKDTTREREVAEVSRSLRLLGIELGCLVISVTQLNEQGKARESRAIQQDATSILAIRLPEGEDSETRTIGIPWQRNGPCGVETTLRFSGRTASFLE